MREIKDQSNKKILSSQLQHPDGYTCSTALSPAKKLNSTVGYESSTSLALLGQSKSHCPAP